MSKILTSKPTWEKKPECRFTLRARFQNRSILVYRSFQGSLWTWVSKDTKYPLMGLYGQVILCSQAQAVKWYEKYGTDKNKKEKLKMLQQMEYCSDTIYLGSKVRSV